MVALTAGYSIHGEQIIMSNLRVWVAPAPTVEGKFGTGPVDLSLGTQSLNMPEGYDIPGGAGDILQRAYFWFFDAMANSTTTQGKMENYLGAVYAQNNLGVWCMTRWKHEEAGQRAYAAFIEAERILKAVLPEERIVLGGVYFNLGMLCSAAGKHSDSEIYLSRARDAGIR